MESGEEAGMGQTRAVLLLTDPLRKAESAGSAVAASQRQFVSDADPTVAVLHFRRGERCLPQAQEALWRLRRRFGWICVAGEGACAGLALALAAQLPVDRVALLGGSPFGAVRTDGGAIGRARELARVDAFARRNLALVVAEILLVNVPDDERRKLIRGLGRGADVHRSEGTVDPAALLEPWTE